MPVDTDTVFLGLLLDEQAVHDEFDAIIAAGWVSVGQEQPPRRPDDRFFWLGPERRPPEETRDVRLLGRHAAEPRPGSATMRGRGPPAGR